ncbi:ABC transporter ATP-binding protein [Synechococcus sp. KORDI-52]|uniref:metal ABC transporter ATP-binding protein n=1 Tax=Synechococcus sp. KORDI-52 TaxID=585425 RepID=UPI0004E09B8B|nr:ABC transporter ATP-binding protein [Synechococcus sp. KORDI-52]AII49123.1 ABC transporter ATP-binding protein [Synechococcus sp. KORDI-52]
MSGSSCVLSTTGLCFSYGGRRIVEDVNLELHGGTLTALVGPNGAGKSTLLHLLEGRLKPSDGSINSNKPIGLMPQRAAIDWSFPITAQDMVRLGMPGKGNTTSENDCNQLLERVGMGAMGSRRLSQLSGGQQQRILLARALMQQTDILLLDEPCSAIDPPTREHLLKVMRDQADAGQTLLVSSHDWGSALDSYDHVVVMDGQILANGSPKTVREKLSDLTCMMGSTCCG